MVLGLVLSGCDKRTDETRSDLSFGGMNQTALLSSNDYPSLNQFLGEMSQQDLMDFLATSLDILNIYNNMGYTQADHYDTLLNIMKNLKETMGAPEEAPEGFDTHLTNNISSILDIMTGADTDWPGCEIGHLLDKVFENLGTGCLTGEIYELLSYIMGADTATLEGAVSGISLQGIIDNKDDFNTLMGVINAGADPTGKYANVYEGLFDYDGTEGIVDQLSTVAGSELKISDIKQILEDIQGFDLSAGNFITEDTETRLDQAITALIKIIEGKSSSLGQADMENIIGLLSDAVSSLNAGDCDNWVEWVIDTSYKKTGGATHNDVLYMCTTDHTSAIDDEPGVGTSWATYWDEVYTWTTDTAYGAGDRVYHNKVLYKCTTAHTSATDDKPGEGANWEDFWDRSSIDPDVMKNALTELLSLFATDGNTRQYLKDLLYSAGLLLTSDDLEGILTEAEDNILNTDVTSRDTLKAFLQNAMVNLPAVTDGARALPDELVDICKNIAQASDADIPGIDTGLYEYSIKRDRFGDLRSVSGEESSLVSLIKSIQNADVDLMIHAVALIIPLDLYALDLVHPQDSGGNDINKDSTRNVAEFLVSEIVRAVKYRWGGSSPSVNNGGAPSSADYDGSGEVDPNEAMYWLFWGKPYNVRYTLLITFSADFTGVLDFAFMQLKDLTALVSSPNNNSYALDLSEPEVSNASTVYPGRIRDFIPALAALSGWYYDVTTSSGHVTAITPVSDPAIDTPQHTLIALMAPLMEYFWDQGEIDNLASLLTDMLDSDTLDDVSGVIVADYDGNYTTAEMLQTLEGTNGIGLLTKALRTHGDEGILDPVLGALAKIITQLNDAGVLDALVTELDEGWSEKYDNPDDDADKRFIDNFIEKYFEDTDALDRTVIDRAEIFLNTNHDALVTMTTDLGNLLINNDATDIDPLLAYITGSSAVDDNTFFNNLNNIWASGTTWDNLKADLDTITPCIKNITGKDSFDILGSLDTVLADLKDLDNPPADIDDKPGTRLLRHLLMEDSSSSTYYNPFVDNLLTILFKAVDIYDETYNPTGGITADTTLVQLISTLSSLYDLKPMQNLLVALTGKTIVASGDLLLWELLSDAHSLASDILVDEEISTAFLQAMFREVPVKGGSCSVISTALDLIKLSAITNDGLSMQYVLEDLAKLLVSLDLEPGGDVYKMIYDVLDFVIQSSYIN